MKLLLNLKTLKYVGKKNKVYGAEFIVEKQTNKTENKTNPKPTVTEGTSKNLCRK